MRLLQELLDGAPDVDSRLHTQMVRRAGGGPFFLINCVQARQFEGGMTDPLHVRLVHEGGAQVHGARRGVAVHDVQGDGLHTLCRIVVNGALDDDGQIVVAGG